MFQKAQESTFLKGGNRRNWTVTFDWLISDSNMAKVLDGNYDDKYQKKDEVVSGGSFATDDFFKAAVRRSYEGGE